MPMVEVLISTMQRENLGFLSDSLLEDKSACCLIVNQDGNLMPPRESARIRVMNVPGRGLTKSRNLAISSAVGTVCLIADDDVDYVEGFGRRVQYWHDKYREADIIIFKIQTYDGNDFRKYPSTIKDLGQLEARGICSIEISFKLDRIREKNLLFDERFGLGATFQAGEEWIFISDALNRGCLVKFVPEVLVLHGENCSADVFNSKRVQAYAATHIRVLGFKSVFYLGYFLVRQLIGIGVKVKLTPLQALKAFFDGAYLLLKTKK